MALLEARPVLSSETVLPVFVEGNFHYTRLQVEETSETTSPPKPLLIVTPTEKGKYPVVMFFHGFYLRNYYYTKLLEHISSHGFIVVAPQLYQYIVPFGIQEVQSAGKVINWLPVGLQSQLPEEVEADLQKLSLVGHSRGGKAAFAVALGYAAPTSLSFSALIGIDPVAGCSKCKCCRTSPEILTYVPHSFNLSIPVTVIGTGLGDKKVNCISPPCAPKDLNHTEFFNECKPPCGHFVATDYGHMDMLDDELPGVLGAISNCSCVNGKGPREPMRRCVGGIVVAFLNACLVGESGDFMTIVREPDVAPVKLDHVVFIEA